MTQKKPNLFTLATSLLNFEYTYMSFSTRKENEYSIHHEYSKTIKEADTSCVSAIMNYILEDGNPFEYEKKELAGLKINIFTRLSRCPMRCKSDRTNVHHKMFKMDHANPKSFFQKNRLFNKLISKSKVNRRNIFSGKNAS